MIGLLTFAVLTTWRKGREFVTASRDRAEGPLSDFITRIDDGRPPLARLPGTAVFLNRGGATAPLSMRANVEHVRVLQEHVLIVSVDTLPVPRVTAEQRVTVDDLGRKDDGIFFVSIRYGYMERPDVPAALQSIDPSLTEGPIDIEHASYFLSKVDLIAGSEPTMAPWRKRLFIAISYMTADAAGYFALPLERTVIVGARIEV